MGSVAVKIIGWALDSVMRSVDMKGMVSIEFNCYTFWQNRGGWFWVCVGVISSTLVAMVVREI